MKIKELKTDKDFKACFNFWYRKAKSVKTIEEALEVSIEKWEYLYKLIEKTNTDIILILDNLMRCTTCGLCEFDRTNCEKCPLKSKLYGYCGEEGHVYSKITYAIRDLKNKKIILKHIKKLISIMKEKLEEI